MSIMDWLRKLGIVRTGAVKGVYTNAKDRPVELMMDNVLDAKKDLVHSSEKPKAGDKKPPAG